MRAALEVLTGSACPACPPSQTADVPLAIDHYRYFAGWADKLQGKVSQYLGVLLDVADVECCNVSFLAFIWVFHTYKPAIVVEKGRWSSVQNAFET